MPENINIDLGWTKKINGESSVLAENFNDVFERIKDAATQCAEAIKIINEIVQGVRNDANNGEFDGGIFTPSVSPEGIISWTNDRDRKNPPAVNIKGPRGEQGEPLTYKDLTEAQKNELISKVTVDPTLTHEGQAADAKAVTDEFKARLSGITLSITENGKLRITKEDI